jgi:putative transposase
VLYQRQSSRPNQIWQADHSQLNVYLLNNEGQAQKPNLTIILDDYSRAVPLII